MDKAKRLRILRIVWRGVVALVGLCTIVAAYGGLVSPEKTPIGALAVMCFPITVIVMALVIVGSYWIDRRAMVCGIFVMLVCGPQVWDFCPLNVFKPSGWGARADSKFTVMTYNVLGFRSYRGNYPSNGTNATLSYIIREKPDIACLVECEYMRPSPRAHVKQSQVDSLLAIYPNWQIDPYGNSLFSKFPFRCLESKATSKRRYGTIAVYRMNIYGREATLFVTHLTSIPLTQSDKQLFKDLTELGAVDEYQRVKSRLIGKLAIAFRYRASQARDLREMIDKYGKGIIIVAGDFNDVPGSYALRTVMGDNLESAWPNSGFGPTITYWGNRFFFRIDHILYNDAVTPLWTRRGSIATSDHYPLMTEFVINPQ